MAGLQAQYAPAMYLGLWSRVDGFARDGLTALLERRAVVGGRLLRPTIHLVSAEDYWPFGIGIRRARRDWLLRTVKGVTAGELDEAAGRLRAALAGGPLRRADLDKLIEPRLRIAVGGWLDMVRVPPSGTWERRRADRYGLAEQWVGPGPAPHDEGVG